MHEGEECWAGCNEAQGACPLFCGASGACCRRGVDWAMAWECGYGAVGCDHKHCCVVAITTRPPRPPPLSPSPPAPPPESPASASAVASRLNERFRNGRPSSDLAHVGVVMHAFDRISEAQWAPWAACDAHGHGPQCHNGYTGRMSCFLSFQRMRDRRDRVAVPFPQWGGGVVASPTLRLKCAYGDDATTAHTWNGCYGQWCDRNDPWKHGSGGSPCGFGSAGQVHANWHPEDLDKMLSLWNRYSQHYQAPGWYSGYNELVYDSSEWNRHLPHSIEAFYIMAEHCELSWWRTHDDTIHRHQAFLRQYGVSANEIPLLCVSPSKWDAPFGVPD